MGQADNLNGGASFSDDDTGQSRSLLPAGRPPPPSRDADSLASDYDSVAQDAPVPVSHAPSAGNSVHLATGSTSQAWGSRRPANYRDQSATRSSRAPPRGDSAFLPQGRGTRGSQVVQSVLPLGSHWTWSLRPSTISNVLETAATALAPFHVDARYPRHSAPDRRQRLLPLTTATSSTSSLDVEVGDSPSPTEAEPSRPLSSQPIRDHDGILLGIGDGLRHLPNGIEETT